MSTGTPQARNPAARRTSDTPTAWPVLVAAMLLFIAPTVTLSQLAAHWRTDVVDDQMFGYYGWRIAHGATVYLDVWDNKPPGIYWTNALGFLLTGGESYAGVIALCATALVAAHAFFFFIAASLYYRGAAAVATCLAAFFLTHAYYQCGANRTETFLIPFELLGVLCYVRGFARDRWWLWLLSGAACGCAFLFKQVGLAAWGAMGLHTLILMLTREIPFRRAMARCFLLLGGVVAVLAVAAGALAARGALYEALYATSGFNRGYFETGDSNLLTTVVNFEMLKWEIWPILQLPVLMALASIIHAALWRLRPLLKPAEVEQPLRAFGPVVPRYVVLLTTWTIVAFWGAMISPHHFRHYIAPMIAPLTLLAGYLINVIQAETKLLTRLQQRAWVTAAFVAMGYFASEAFRREFEVFSKVYVARFEQHEPAEWESVGRAVAEVTKPGDTIQCSGYMPGVYLVSRRINATRFTTMEKIGQLDVGAKGGNKPDSRLTSEAERIAREIRDKLAAHPPAAYVMSASDYEWISGRIPDGRPIDWLGHWMIGWLNANYTRVADVPQFNDYIFKRNDLVKQESARTRD